jgi:general stress protein YciG
MTRARYTPEERRERWRLGGRISPGNFANDPDRAVEAGRAGGFVANFRTQGHARRARARVGKK